MDEAQLKVPFSEEEVKRAISDYDIYKSLDLDGINFDFIKEFWEGIKTDIMWFIFYFNYNSRLVKGSNYTFIALIPQVSYPHKLSNFCLISLVGCM